MDHSEDKSYHKVFVKYDISVVIQSELREWLKENIGDLYHTLPLKSSNRRCCFQYSNDGIFYYFRNKEDAILFKLLWG